ncbi:MAG: hypothetical protein AABX52_01120, partial [Nanoarchaeota archaeon]
MLTLLDSLLQDASYFVKAEFNLKLIQSELKLYSQENWQQFCQTNNFGVSSGGLYVPASYSAYVNTKSLCRKNSFQKRHSKQG